MSELAPNSVTPVDASAGPVTMTLPTGQLPGTEIAVEKLDSSANAVTVTGSVQGAPNTSITLILPRESMVFRADGSGSWWPFAGHIPRTSLNLAYAAKPAVDATGYLKRVADGTVSWAPVSGGGSGIAYDTDGVPYLTS